MPALWKRTVNFAKRHWPATGLVIFVILYAMTPHSLERRFIYFPIREVHGNPSALGLAYQELAIITEDGVKLHGWLVPFSGSRRTLLIFHGNAGNIGHRLEWIQMLHALGANVFIIDYRGYGKSEGRPFEEGLYRDARAAYQWWANERAGGGEKLILLGESLGGVVAVDLAARFQPAGLILQSTFTSAWDMAKTVLPFGLLQPLAGIHFDAAAKIGGISCPKLFIHGNRDDIVPLRLGRRLYEMAREPKQFYEVSGAGHNDLIWVAEPEYSIGIRKFLEQVDQTP